MRSKSLIAAVLGSMAVLSLTTSAWAHLHPGLGRFMQRDPLEYVDGMQVYLYARENPVRFTDPSGRVPPCLAYGAEVQWFPIPGGEPIPYCLEGTLVRDREFNGTTWVELDPYCLVCMNVTCRELGPNMACVPTVVEVLGRLVWTCHCSEAPHLRKLKLRWKVIEETD